MWLCSSSSAYYIYIYVRVKHTTYGTVLQQEKKRTAKRHQNYWEVLVSNHGIIIIEQIVYHIVDTKYHIHVIWELLRMIFFRPLDWLVVPAHPKRKTSKVVRTGLALFILHHSRDFAFGTARARHTENKIASLSFSFSSERLNKQNKYHRWENVRHFFEPVLIFFRKHGKTRKNTNTTLTTSYFWCSRHYSSRTAVSGCRRRRKN